VFENRVLRGIFGPKREEEDCIMREFLTFYASSNIIKVIKSRRMKWEGNVARMGEIRNSYRILAGKPEEITMKTSAYIGE
jgi:hypothetical protein